MEKHQTMTLRGKPAMEGIAIGVLRFSDLAEEEPEHSSVPLLESIAEQKERFIALREEVSNDYQLLAERAR